MTKLTDLRGAARQVFDSALIAADARQATRSALRIDGQFLHLFNQESANLSRQIYVVGMGKAAPAMAAGLSDVLGERITQGVITSPFVKAEQILDPNRWRFFSGGHPLPNEASLAAAQASLSLLDRANAECALVIFLISGGGSAAMEWPVDPQITIEELREANRQLVSCGATISEINAVRRAFSAIKGGGLAARAPHAEQITLIVSDTNQGEESTVASGPSLSPPSNAPSPEQVLTNYHLASVLAPSILNAIRQYQGNKRLKAPTTYGKSYLLLDNGSALNAAAENAHALGFLVEVAQDICEQGIEEGCRQLISRLTVLRERCRQASVCLISGGEFSCPVKGNGLGGRNLETVLRCAIELSENSSRSHTHSVILSAGTDGLDGNSLAAGAIGDETTITRAQQLGLNAPDFLERSDAFNFFRQLADTIVTGPTNTNVRDLRILLASG